MAFWLTVTIALSLAYFLCPASPGQDGLGPFALRQALFFGVSSLSIARIFQGRNGASLGLRLEAKTGVRITFCALLAGGIFGVCIGLLAARRADSTGISNHGEIWLREPVLAGLAFAVAHGAQELFFRGLLVLNPAHTKRWRALIIPLPFYVAMHVPKGPFETLGAVLAGLVLGELAWRTKSILPSWAAHFAAATAANLSLAIFGR